MLITMASHHLPSHGDLDERCPEFFPGAEVDDGMRLWGVHVDELRHSIEQYGAVNHHRKEPALMAPCNKRSSGRAGPLTRLRDIVHQVVHMARIATHENPWNLRLAILVHHWSFGHRIHGHTQRLADLVLWNKADRQDDAVTAQPFFRSRNRAHLLIDRRRFHGFDAVVPENAGHGSRQMQWNTKIVQTLRDIARETRRCRLGFKNAQHFSPLQREPACHDEPDVATAQDDAPRRGQVAEDIDIVLGSTCSHDSRRTRTLDPVARTTTLACSSVTPLRSTSIRMFSSLFRCASATNVDVSTGRPASRTI